MSALATRISKLEDTYFPRDGGRWLEIIVGDAPTPEQRQAAIDERIARGEYRGVIVWGAPDSL